jgi:hypothetical protein
LLPLDDCLYALQPTSLRQPSVFIRPPRVHRPERSETAR